MTVISGKEAASGRRALGAAAAALLLVGTLVSGASAQNGGNRKPAPDEEPPVVTIVRPLDGGIVSERQVVVTGVVRDKSTIASVTINDQPVALDRGRFSATVPLADGTNSILVIATDEQGNFGTARVKVTLRG